MKDIYVEIEEKEYCIKIKTRNVVDITGRSLDNIKNFCTEMLSCTVGLVEPLPRYIIIFALSNTDMLKGDYDNLNFKVLQDIVCSAFIPGDDDGPQYIDVLYTVNKGDTSDIYISKEYDIFKILKEEGLMTL